MEEHNLLSMRELASRFEEEDIELFAELTIAIVHPNDPDLKLDKCMVTIHATNNEEKIVAQWDGLSLQQIVERLGIDHDTKVWEVADPG